MNPCPALPKRLGLLGCALLTSLLAACSAKTVRLDREQPAAEADGAAGSPSQGQQGLELVYANPGYAFVARLLVDDTRLYWQTDNGERQHLQSCLKDDCQDSVITYSDLLDGNSDSAFAISGGTVYWLGHPPGTIFACPNGGCSGQPTRIIRDPALDTVVGITAHDGDVYWLSSGDLYHCGANGCGDVPQRAALGEGTLPLFVDSTAFWVTADQARTSIRRAPDDGSAEPQTLLDFDGWRSVPLAPSREQIYWHDGISILRCPPTGCGQEPAPFLAGTAHNKESLRAYDDGVYWLERPEDPFPSPRPNAVHHCSHSGCSDNTIAARKDEISEYAIDDDYIYLVNEVPFPTAGRRPGGSIHRVPKPR